MTLLCALVLGILVPGVIGAAIVCYQCENAESNEICNQATAECSLAFDTCQTIVHYSAVAEKLLVTKTCATMESCHRQNSTSEKHQPCDRTHGEWSCVECCSSHRCNVNGGSPPPPVSLLLLFLLAGLCLLCDSAR